MSRIVRALIASGIFLALSSRACGAGIPEPKRSTPGPIPPTLGFDLAWHDCIGLPSAAQNVDYACDGSRDGNPFKLVVTFTPPSNLEHFVGVDVWMEIRTASSLLPDWWRLDVGECRYGHMTFPGSRAGIGTGATGACIDPWASAANTGGGYLWHSDMGVFGCNSLPGCGESIHPGYGALRLAFARDSEIPLQAGQRYLIAPILLEPAVFAADTCPGCAAPTCLFVHGVYLNQVAGSPGGDIIMLNRPIERAFVTWQGGLVECSNAVEVKRKTWGAIKAIYR